MRRSIASTSGASTRAPRVSTFHTRRAVAIDTLRETATQLHIKDFAVREERGRILLSGIARYQLDSEFLFEAVKRIPRWQEKVMVELDVENRDVRGFHTVARGETLASIAKRHLGSESRELEIFAANRDRMNDPDQILPGQQLLIPRR